MADPLSLLRQFHIQKRDIIERNDMICFGEYCWPKRVKTNYLIYSSSRDGPAKSYYTLECLLFFLKNVHLQHPTYVKQAASLDIPVVQRPDRKDLLAYLSGEVAISASIDRSAPIEVPLSVAQLHKELSSSSSSAANASSSATTIVNQSASGSTSVTPAGAHHVSFDLSTIDHHSGSIGGDGTASSGQDGQEHLVAAPTPSKLARLDEMEKVRKQFAARLDAPKIKKPLPLAAASITTGGGNNDLRGNAGGINANLNSGATDATGTSLREALSLDQIAALKAKRLAKKRSTIIDADNELDATTTTGLNNQSSVQTLLQFDSNVTKEIQNKERVWRNRTNILQSSGKNFQKTIFPVLLSVKYREENGPSYRGGRPSSHHSSMVSNSSGGRPSGGSTVSGGANSIGSGTGGVGGGSSGVSSSAINSSNIGGGGSGVGQSNGPSGGAAVGGGGGGGANVNVSGAFGTQQYNRYDQERFTKTDAPIGFRIDTTSTYHGLTLKSVTEGSAPKPNTGAGGSGGASSMQNGSNNNHHHSGLSSGQSSGQKQPQKRISRTPIIIIPATNTSLITMYNAKNILEDLIYVDSKSCDQRRESEILIQRRKPDNSTVPYRIIDNPTKLAPEDWNRVVAVFVQGPAWQFKGWPWDGNPVEIFARIKAFHLKFDEMKTDKNVEKWSVEIINLSRSRRHLDRANLLKFWSKLDQHIMKHKHSVVRH